MSKLSERLRPDVECAPWVLAEVEKLEAENAKLREAIRWACGEVSIGGMWFGDGIDMTHRPFWWRVFLRRFSGVRRGHDRDCAMHNDPAYPNGECNCGVEKSPD